MEWPPSHWPKLQRHRNIKDVLRSPFFWVSESLGFEEAWGSWAGFTFFLLIFINKPISVGERCWCTVYYVYSKHKHYLISYFMRVKWYVENISSFCILSFMNEHFQTTSFEKVTTIYFCICIIFSNMVFNLDVIIWNGSWDMWNDFSINKFLLFSSWTQFFCLT